jgi:colanic acid biosynthesis protein WcaH
MDIHYLSDEDFFSIYSKVPRLNIDLVIRSDEGILLALRTIEPNLGCWHLPGGTVYKTEKIIDAAVRIAEKETGLIIRAGKCLGYMEFPHEMRSGVEIHTISILIEAFPIGGELRHDENAKELRYFKDLPEKMIPEHGEFLKKSI